MHKLFNFFNLGHDTYLDCLGIVSGLFTFAEVESVVRICAGVLSCVSFYYSIKQKNKNKK